MTVTGSIIVAVVNRPRDKGKKEEDLSPELKFGQRVLETNLDQAAERIADLKERIEILEEECDQYRVERNMAWDQLRGAGIEPIYPRHGKYRK